MSIFLPGAATLKLYRGDGTKIQKYDFHKTNRYCYRGQGVYLTNSVPVAETYRTKGAYTPGGNFFARDLWTGRATDRTHAKVLAREVFFRDWEHVARYESLTNPWDNAKLDIRKVTPEACRRFMDKAARVWEMLDADGRIKVEYIDNLSLSQIRAAKERHLKVTLDTSGYKAAVGWLTSFEFPKIEFEAACPNVDRTITDTMFWEIVWDKGVKFGTSYADRDSFVKCNSSGYGNVSHVHGATNSTWVSLRSALEPFGYRGFEYNGGVHVGGLGRHRAFVIWDDEYVNQHRTGRLK